VSTKLDRRQALGALGTISLGGLLAACGKDAEPAATAPVATTDGATATVAPRTSTSAATAALFDESARCSLTPEETEGPFYFDVDRIRSDIREDREGTPLRLALRVRDAGSCDPLKDAVVDIWHCDAAGGYSGFDDGGGSRSDTHYLRGAQVTNADGVVEFATIYPGWYQGRTVHIHAKVHLDRRTVLTTQLYFDDDVSDAVFRDRRYAGRGERDQRNSTDTIFDDALLLTLAKERGGHRGVMTFDVRSA
jgi:protocatechuate 3,4-dioxygenase beta subunit